MELLKKITFTLIVYSLVCQVNYGQDFIKKKDAFQKSYIEEAKKEYLKAANLLKAVYDEKSYEINLRLGWLNYLEGNHSESKMFYTRAISLMPYSVEAKLGLVYPLAALGNMNEVIVQYEKILEIVPNYSIVLYRLGLIYYEKGEYEAAMKYFDKVVNMWPFDYDGLTMLGWTNFKLNNAREARVLFQKALLHTPDGTSAIEGLGLLK
jgi:tetratricopeptide (TPR) repeat protein